ncbi:MAG: tetratricopeptide repeat protein [Leptolyngbya sp. RL_3_1]|nr:tetratricopeptide repeat protein [Leptolyngbya sp. RL_3_1]
MGPAEIPPQALAFMTAFRARWEAIGEDTAQLNEFLKDHLDDLNKELLTALPLIFRIWTTAKSLHQLNQVVAVFGDFGNTVWKFPLGDRALNLELSISTYKAILQIYPRAVFPQDWAITQNNLASSYLYRIRGDRAENIERAISSYKAALEIKNKDDFPGDWAQIQNNLGSAYLYRIAGTRAENIEQAISAYEATLKIKKRKSFPEEWAQIQNNLGNAYVDRIQGKRADNIEQAILSYEAALEIRVREIFPMQWAMTQVNLGTAYDSRLYGVQEENQEKALLAYESALQVYSQEAFPWEWANLQNNLGAAYKTRIRGRREENISRAVIAYEAALQVYSPESFPEQWANTQGNLISALLERSEFTGKIIDLDKAISDLGIAGKIASQGTESYANVYYTLGAIFEYRYRLHQDSSALLQASAAYKEAATATPWADRKLTYRAKAGDSLYQLGVALTQDGQWYEGLAQLEASLDTYRQAENRLGRADALQQIARTHYLMGNFDKARMYFRDALRLYQAEANPPGEAACRAGLGRLLLRLNFVDDAIAELNQACDQYRTLGDDTHLANVQDTYELAQKLAQKLAQET